MTSLLSTLLRTAQTTVWAGITSPELVQLHRLGLIAAQKGEVGGVNWKPTAAGRRCLANAGGLCRTCNAVARDLLAPLCADCERRPGTDDHDGELLCAGCYDSRGEMQDERGAA